MKTELEVFYAQKLTREPHGTCAVMVRYSDACAAIEKLEARIAQLERVPEEDSTVKGTVEAFEEIMRQLPDEPPIEKAREMGLKVAGRWDEKCKVL